MISYRPVICADMYSREEPNCLPRGGPVAVVVQNLSFCRMFQSFRHAARVSGRPRLHLMHHTPAMDGGGNFARPEYRGDLLCLHTGNYEVHHVTLTRGQAFVPFLQFRHLIALTARQLVALQGLLNRVQKLLMPEWFRQELKSTRLHGLYGRGNIPVRDDENDGDIDTRFDQLLLGLESAHSRKAHIQHQATRKIWNIP